MTLVALSLLGVALLIAAILTPPQPATAPTLEEALHVPILPQETAHAEIRAYLEKRIPPLPSPASAAAWEAEADRLRQRILEEVVFRGVPAPWRKGRTAVEWGDRIATSGGYAIRKLRYQAVPGLWIPALLYEPDHLAGRVPAVLNVNGHVGAPGKAIDYEQLRCINLAKRGMLALHPEWFNCGELFDPEFNHNRLAYLDLCGCSGVAVFHLAMQRALDILAAHAHADPARLAMTGLSGGGWQTIWLSALDRRIAATAPDAGYIGLHARLYNPGDIGDLEQNPVDLLRASDYTHLTAMLSPRPALLLYNENDDCCFQTARARPSVYEPIRPFYQLFDREAALRFHNNVVPGTHNYEQDNREQFYRFLNDVFHPEENRRDAEIPAASELLSFDALRAGTGPAAGGKPGFGQLAGTLLPRLPLNRWGADPTPAAARRWQARSRRTLAEILRLHSEPPAVPATASAPAPGPDGCTIVRRTLRIGESWTLPLVELSPPGRSAGTAVVVAQEGREKAGPMAARVLAHSLTVGVVDLALCGECDPPDVPRWQHAAMIGTVGERLLGIQVAQLRSVIAWAEREAGGRPVTVAGTGRAGSAIAIVTAAVSSQRFAELIAAGLPASLKLLIEQRLEYEACPELFCFGLLEHFDIRELLGMARAERISLLRLEGSAERIRAELQPAVEFQRRLGTPVER